MLFALGSSAIIPQAKAAESKSAAAWVPGTYEAYLSSGYLGISKSSYQYDITPGFQYKKWISWLQLGGEITYQKVSHRGGSGSNIMFLLGPTAIFEGFGFSLGPLLKMGGSDGVDETKDDPNGFGFYFLVAKHFSIAPGWSLRPSVGIVSAGATGLVIRPFALSYTF